MLDLAKLKEAIKGKAKDKSKDESDDLSPGEMLLAAIKENDAEAVEEAIHLCYSRK